MTTKLSKPIALDDFRRALLKAWEPKQQSGQPAVLGLAISGGVDSMAMAYLCSKLEQREPKRFQFKAFIVDHRARPKSSIEAVRVLSALQKLGLASSILDLSWPLGLSPLHQNDFETLCRTLRFRSLGSACWASGIDSLLLAHHKDDQAETLMIRIIQGRTGLGLRGIKPKAAIPECYGYHGLHENCNVAEHQSRSLASSAPGISIVRPFLDYHKNSLVATCLDSETSWFNDETNDDKTLTPRNTIRHLLTASRLPQALRAESLLAVGHVISNNVKRSEVAIDAIESSLDRIDLDTRSGRLVLQGRKILELATLFEHEEMAQEGTTVRKSIDALMFFRRMAYLITPYANLSSVQIARVVEHIASWAARTSVSSSQFTGAGISWSLKWRQPTSGSPCPAITLARQPYAVSEKPTCQWHSLSHGSTPSGAMNRNGSDPWQLFDGRFWLKVRNHSDSEVVARSLRQQDMTKLREHLSWPGRKRMDAILKITAPDRERYALPALTQDDEVFALPTLGVQIAMKGNKVMWDSRYRNIKIRPRDIQNDPV